MRHQRACAYLTYLLAASMLSNRQRGSQRIQVGWARTRIRKAISCLAGPLVFVDVDTQRDFLEPTGALYVAGGDEIIPNLARLSEFARRHRVPVLATACSHHLTIPS